MSAAAKNLKALSDAIDQHDARCANNLVEIRMCAFEVDRLGWDTFRGIPIVADPDLGTGRFRLICAGDDAAAEDYERALGKPLETAPA